MALGDLCSTVKLCIPKDTLSFQLSQPYLLPKWAQGEIIQELCRRLSHWLHENTERPRDTSVFSHVHMKKCHEHTHTHRERIHSLTPRGAALRKVRLHFGWTTWEVILKGRNSEKTQREKWKERKEGKQIRMSRERERERERGEEREERCLQKLNHLRPCCSFCCMKSRASYAQFAVNHGYYWRILSLLINLVIISKSSSL